MFIEYFAIYNDHAHQVDGEALLVLITVSMVKKLEEELKYSVLFDCIVGSSLGGILALGLVASKESNYRLLKTDDLIKLFEEFPHDIFHKKLQRKNKLILLTTT